MKYEDVIRIALTLHSPDPVQAARSVVRALSLEGFEVKPVNSGSVNLTGLTPRQTQIAEAAARGLRNKEIAIALGVTESTVKQSIRVIFAKLRINNRTRLSALIN